MRLFLGGYGGWLVNGPARVSRPRVAKTAADSSAQVLVLWPSRALCPCELILSSPARSFPVAYVAVTPLLGVMGAPRRAAVTVWRSSVHSRSMASSDPRGSLHCVDGQLCAWPRSIFGRPGTGSGGDGTSHLLVLQQLDVQISFSRPRGAGDVAQPCRGQVEGGLPVRECTDDARAPPDVAQDALERVLVRIRLRRSSGKA